MYFTTWIMHLNILLHLHVILYVDNGFFFKITRAVKDIYVKTKCTNRWILNPYKGAFIGSIVQSNPVVCVGAKFFSIKKNDKRNDKLFGYGVKNISLFNVQTLYLLVRVLF